MRNPGYGIVAAAPGPRGETNRQRRTGGTSAAAALATRFAHRLFDALTDRNNGNVLADADPRYHPLVVRALLVHSCRWDEEAAEQVTQSVGPPDRRRSTERADNVARFLGQGVPREEAVTTCAADRATLIGYGDIEPGQALAYEVPLPTSLSGQPTPRAVTVTLAWFSPVTARNQVYRLAKLAVDGHSCDQFGTGQRSSAQPGYHAVRRGTVFHERYEGEAVTEFTDDDCLSLRITCSAPAGALDESIPFGVAVSIEAGEGVPIYEEIRASLAVRVRT